MIIYGRNAVAEAIKSSFKIKEIILQENINVDSRVAEIIRLAGSQNIQVTYLNSQKVAKLANFKEHQMVLADVEFYEYKLKNILENINYEKSFIYISEATYEQNVGAIIRTAECAGLAGVIVPSNINITATVIKTSAGAALHIPIIKMPIYEAIKELKNKAFKIVGIERNGNKLYKEDVSGNCLFVIGGEDKSLSDQLRERCDVIVEIPQFGKVNSLNMSVASSIVIYEHLRQNLSK